MIIQYFLANLNIKGFGNEVKDIFKKFKESMNLMKPLIDEDITVK